MRVPEQARRRMFFILGASVSMALLLVRTSRAVQTAAVAGDASSKRRPAAALTGVWKMNATKSVFDPGPPFKAFTLTFTADGVRHLDLVRAHGEVFKADLPPSDGKKVQVIVKEGAGEGLEAVSKTREGTFEDVWTANGRVIEKVHGRTSADGKTLTVEVAGPAEGGGSYRNRIVFDRETP